MRTLRNHIIDIYTVIGIISTLVVLLLLTGFLLGILTPRAITVFLATASTHIAESKVSWWFGVLGAWIVAGWTILFLIRTHSYPPLQITEDDSGVVEVTTQALCSLARAELREQGITGPCKAEFTKKLGSPMLHVWCDLDVGAGDEGLVARGNRLKSEIETRLREDFNLRGIRVAIIHQPRPRPFRRDPMPAG